MSASVSIRRPDFGSRHVGLLGIADPIEPVRPQVQVEYAPGSGHLVQTLRVLVEDVAAGSAIVDQTWTSSLLDDDRVEYGGGILTRDLLPYATAEFAPGALYDITATVTDGTPSTDTAGPRRFRLPYGEAVYAFALGYAPERVGASASIVPDQGRDDVVAVHYARSTDGTEAGIVTPWSADGPTSWPDDADAWLMARVRIYRRTPGYVPPEPEGLDRLEVNWRRYL